jgi:hypothetical protein
LLNGKYCKDSIRPEFAKYNKFMNHKIRNPNDPTNKEKDIEYTDLFIKQLQLCVDSIVKEREEDFDEDKYNFYN